MNTEEKKEQPPQSEECRADLNRILREIFLGPLFEVPNKA